MAVPLTQYLDPERGSYDGVDPVMEGILWCAQTITPAYPRFRFQRLDIAHPLYNPAGSLPGIEVRFGDPKDNVPGKVIVLPEHLDQVRGRAQDMDHLRRSYLKNAAKAHPVDRWTDADVAFLAADLKKDAAWVKAEAQTLAH